MKRSIVLLLTGLFCFQFTFAQLAGKDNLLVINGQEISKDEFLRVYNKNNNNNTYDPKSVDEYLDLFINFKLKVMEAEALKYNEQEDFVKELAGYREQLAKPYFESEEVREQLIQEAYNRTVNEVEVSHILIRTMDNATPDEIEKSKSTAQEIYGKLKSGEITWEDAIDTYVTDLRSKDNNGYIGYISAFVTVYPFEEAAYNTPVGEFSEPVQTRFGFHIVKVHNKRKSFGEARAAHLYVRVNREATEEEWKEAKEKIDGYYSQIKRGENFEDLVKKFSDDTYSASKGGDIGWFKAGKMVPEFAEATFALDSVGAISEPVKTPFGYHIIKLLGEKPVGSFDELKESITRKVKTDQRNKMPQEVVMEKLKKENNFVENPDALSELITILENKVYRKNDLEDIPSEELSKEAFSLAGISYTYDDFVSYLETLKSPQGGKGISFITSSYEDYILNTLKAEEDKHLEDKYPDFKYLIQEYHDGILLFNLMDDKIWSKASEDTAGLELYYDENKNDYMWEQRADYSLYTYKDSLMFEEIKQAALNRISTDISEDSLVKVICPDTVSDCLKVKDGLVEKGRNALVDEMNWESGAVSNIYKEGSKFNFIVINNILEPSVKELDECRGLVIADYQNKLEGEWIEELKAKADILVNAKLLKKIKKQYK